MSPRVRMLAIGILVVLGTGIGAASLMRPSTAVVEAGPALPASPPQVVPAAAAPRTVAPKKTAVPKPKPKPKPRPQRVVTPPKKAVRVVSRPKAIVHTETANQRGQRVLASLHYDWQKLGYKIVFLPERKGYLGFTDGATKTVTIWVRARETDLVLAHTIAHELGHVLDFTHGTDAKHATYLSLRNLSPTTPWYGCSGCTDYRTPAGDWAEVFAYWLAGPGDFRSQMGPPPDHAHMLAIAQLYSF